ncbi:MAG: TolC family protein, partial [Gemmatimonadales bacterium]
MISPRRLLAALVAAGGTVVLAGCVGTPRVSGVPAASPAPEVPWTPPPSAVRPVAAGDTSARAAVPADLADRIRRLTLAEIVDIGLRNNANTRLAWANAQAAASAYGSERGTWLPTIEGDVSGVRIKTAASQGRTAVEQSVFTPSVTLSYLLFDFGGRTGRVRGARQRLLAASFTHNAAIQDVILQIEVAYFQYLANRALLEAQRTTLAEAQTNLTAAEERRRVGVATVADVLQARTAVSQAQLDLQTIEGNVQTTRGALALALGLPANLPYDVDSTAAAAPVAPLADSVNALIAAALVGRPDLAAARSEAEAARAGIGEARSALLPSLNLSATGGRTYATTIPDGDNSYNLALGLTIPIFSGFSRQYDLRTARFEAEAAGARAETLR